VLVDESRKTAALRCEPFHRFDFNTAGRNGIILVAFVIFEPDADEIVARFIEPNSGVAIKILIWEARDFASTPSNGRRPV
jgi:hypothetical protein